MERPGVIKQANTIIIMGRMDDYMAILQQAIEAGYGHLPAVYSIKLWLERN